MLMDRYPGDTLPSISCQKKVWKKYQNFIQFKNLETGKV